MPIDPNIKRLFESPSGEFMPVPWWCWTGSLDLDLLRRQLDEMHKQGIREFFIYPAYGMEPDYMGEVYLNTIGQVLDWCKDLNMKVWIYDELNWPSGTAAGLVPRNHPEAVAAHVHLEDLPEVSASEVKSLLDDAAVLHVVEIKPDGSPAAITEQTLASSEKLHVQAFRRKRDDLINFTVRGCLWTKNDPGMLNLLSKKAVRAFIDEAYEPIAKAFSSEFGSSIKGFFTDEPQFGMATIPWTDGIDDEFKKRFGYDLLPRLHELIIDVPGCDRLRVDFWSLAADLCASSFTGQLAEWCGERGMALTGHLVHEESSYSVWWDGDGPEHLLKMQVPGCDLLNLNNSFTDPQSWYEFGAESIIKTAKNPSTAARFTGHNRVLCESYGVVPWWKTQADEKWITDWLVALGVNMINDNNLTVDITDFRKRAASGKHFTQPYWDYEHMYYTYAGRISALVAETVLDTELLLLFPTTTWWANVHAGSDTPKPLRELERAFDVAADVLVRKHWNFEFLYEQILEKARVEDGKLVTDHGTFRGIVIAGISHLRPQHAAKLEEFDASGGVTFLVASDIQVLDKDGNRPLVLKNAVRFENWRLAGFYDEFNEALKDRISRPWSITGPISTNVISAARVDKLGGKYLFIANMTAGDKKLDVSWDPGAKVEFWDADGADKWTPEQSGGKLSFVLPEDQSVWLVQSDAATERTDAPAHFVVKSSYQLEIAGQWSFSTDRPNLLNLDYVLKPDVDGSFDPATLKADDTWARSDHGEVGIQLQQDKMKHYWVAIEFDLGVPVSDLQLVVDSVYTEEAYLNGESLGANAPISVWDDQNRAWELGAKAKAGRNTLLLRVKPTPYNAQDVCLFPVTMAEPVALRGSFAVGDSGKLVGAPSKLSVGDWKDQGFRHFAGTGTYENSLEWGGGDALISVCGGRDVVEVLIDGVSLGRRAWARRQYAAKNLTAGKHKIEVRITNTLVGVLRRPFGGYPVSDLPQCGLLSPVKISALQPDEK